MKGEKMVVGTSKGLVILVKTGDHWVISQVLFEGLPVSFFYADDRSSTWWVGISHKHWGDKLHQSTDQGLTWKEKTTPSYRGFEYRPGKPASLMKLWTMQHAGADRPGCFWLGTEPGGLFYTADNGSSFSLNLGLWHHPSRMDDNQWFGTGKDYPFIHSIQVDPRDSNHLYLAISCAGIFETTDNGQSWAPRNRGLKASYLPFSDVAVGHDPHRLLMCKAHPDVLWQQNHCGIFRTTDGGHNWQDVSGNNDFPTYGFALAIDDTDPLVAYVIPAQSDLMRLPHLLRLSVCKTVDGGKHWERMANGLPSGYVFDLALRQALTKWGNTLAFGTNNGNLYFSDDLGVRWKTVSQNLATVHCVSIL